MRSVAFALVLIVLVVHSTAAQAEQVMITPQVDVVLRAGPGTSWQRLAVLPAGTSYPATGRTIDGNWVQIAYSGPLEATAPGEFTVGGLTYGWVAAWLVVWNGDVLQMPIDGEVRVPIARVAGPTIVIGPETFVYDGEVTPSARIPSPAASPVTVEVTGRLGSADGSYVWLQFKMNGQYYWTASWSVGVPEGYEDVLNAAYLYPYSRMTVQFEQNLSEASLTLNDIALRWRTLEGGRPTTCNHIPDDLDLPEFASSDLRLEPSFSPISAAFANVEAGTNEALALFRAACQEADRQVEPQQMRTALDFIESAERNLTLATHLIQPIQRRDPLLDN